MASYAFAYIFCFANIDRFSGYIIEIIYARGGRQFLQLLYRQVWRHVLLAVLAFEHGGNDALCVFLDDHCQQICSGKGISASSMVLSVRNAQPLSKLAQAIAIKARHYLTGEPYGAELFSIEGEAGVL